MMYSDDLGDTWQLGGLILSPDLPNECQAVDLGNNTILVNSRSLNNHRLLVPCMFLTATAAHPRLQSLSYDGGLTFPAEAQQAPELFEPWEGCEGSTISYPGQSIDPRHSLHARQAPASSSSQTPPRTLPSFAQTCRSTPGVAERNHEMRLAYEPDSTDQGKSWQFLNVDEGIAETSLHALD